MKRCLRSLVPLLILLPLGTVRTLAANSIALPADGARARFVTNAAQFWTLTPEDFLASCSFCLEGTITLVDANRNFLVLQDGTGAVGIYSQIQALNLRAGESVSLVASNCSPAFVNFPDFPHRPSGWRIRDTFEAPSNWGEYHLTRMRSYLRPPVSGQYTFWIASDNSSELWLSTGSERFKMRKIASVARYEWTLIHEWSKFPSQRSEGIWLNAGQSYYIEALQEQTGGGDNLAVAWQGPNLPRSVIPSDYLTPWNGGHYVGAFPQTNGVLYEYWTNFSAGDLAGIGGPRPFQSTLSAENLRVEHRGAAHLPKPYRISSAAPWPNQNNYRWAEAEGTVTFASESGDNLFVQLADGKTTVQVRTLNPGTPLPRVKPDVPVRVQGVCEATYDESTTLTPGLIWVTTANGISVMESANTNSAILSTNEPPRIAANQPSAAMGGFYATRGVVTFSDRVMGKDCLFVQEGNAAMFVSLESFAYHNPLKVGQLLDLGGALKTDKSLPTITPLVFTEVGWRALPAANTEAIQTPVSADRDGKWTELQGVVHGINSDGTLSVMGPRELVSVWLGKTSSNELSHYVDAKVRLRGVLSLSSLPVPMLLVPSRNFVEVDESAALDPFSAPYRKIADLKRDTAAPSALHRVKVIGKITLKDAEWFFVQDGTSGIRIQSPAGAAVQVGQAVEVVGFPTARDATRVLSDAVVRPATTGSLDAEPLKLDLTESLPGRQNGSLIRVEATLLKSRTVGNSQILELQHEGRVFTSTLPVEHGRLKNVLSGSQVSITGVCDTDSTAVPRGTTAKEKAAFASLNIWLRSPGDLIVLSGPPWWTWKRTALLIGTLFSILTAALLWVYFLRRRLHRQKALQLAFSRQVLERLEDERRRIAANLHDGLGQVLLAIRNQALVAMQRSQEENGIRQHLAEISDTTSQALDEVRQITHGLRPYQLNRLGLTQAIRATLNQVSSDSRIVFANRVDDMDGIFDQDSEIHVYRIVQESINNVIKHSSANEAAVVIKNRKNVISLSIRDNGRGFDLNSVSPSEPSALGYGLSGIAERVRILGGTLSIDSRPGKGTSLSIEIPVTLSKDESRNNHIDR